MAAETNITALNDRIAELERTLLAKDKTLAVLLEKVQRGQEESSSAFQTLASNATLQRIVENKTRELEERNFEIEAAHADLRLTQDKLLKAQKLESIGTLAAGVAHEINTPIQFIGDSVHFIRDALTDLFVMIDRLLDLNKQLTSGGLAVSELEGKVNDIIREQDYEYLVQNVPTSVDRASDGLARVAEIVKSMKAFGHPGQKTMSPADINENIHTTLMVATNEYKYVAEIVTELGDLPMVECLGSELNQVFLNLIINATHAIEAANKGLDTMGTITIRTRKLGSTAIIEIRDSGCGMPENIHKKVFDPFFTTKEIGKGTGQGLALAHQVICAMHGGEIWFESEEGEGTSFFISIPISQAGRVEQKAA